MGWLGEETLLLRADGLKSSIGEQEICVWRITPSLKNINDKLLMQFIKWVLDYIDTASLQS